MSLYCTYHVKQRRQHHLFHNIKRLPWSPHNFYNTFFFCPMSAQVSSMIKIKQLATVCCTASARPFAHLWDTFWKAPRETEITENDRDGGDGGRRREEESESDWMWGKKINRSQVKTKEALVKQRRCFRGFADPVVKLSVSHNKQA